MAKKIFILALLAAAAMFVVFVLPGMLEDKEQEQVEKEAVFEEQVDDFVNTPREKAERYQDKANNRSADRVKDMGLMDE